MPIDPIRDLPDLWVLRHGETEWNVAQRLQGRLDSPLTPHGVAQAELQGRILRQQSLPQGTRCVTSPSGRALRTAQIVACDLNLRVEQDPALMEIDLGDWQGMYLSEIPAARAAEARGDDPHLWKFSGPGCETVAEMAVRLTRFLGALDGPAVIVTHGVTSRMLRCLATGRTPEALSAVPGGQGVVHHVKDGVAQVLSDPVQDADT